MTANFTTQIKQNKPNKFNKSKLGCKFLNLFYTNII